MCRASVCATWSNVLWSSLRTMTRQLPPSSLSGPSGRGSWTVSDTPRRVASSPFVQVAPHAEVEVVRRRRLEVLRRQLGGLLLHPIRDAGLEGLLPVLGRQPQGLVQALAHLAQVRRDVVDAPVVCERERGGLPALDHVE